MALNFSNFNYHFMQRFFLKLYFKVPQIKKVYIFISNTFYRSPRQKFKALKDKNFQLLDSIEQASSNNQKRKYLFTANFALNHKDFEIAPYLALSEIKDINLKYLDTIQKSMSPKVSKSLYGKQLIMLYNQRLKDEK